MGEGVLGGVLLQWWVVGAWGVYGVLNFFFFSLYPFFYILFPLSFPYCIFDISPLFFFFSSHRQHLLFSSHLY